jgi:hypothetical protein
MLGVEMVIVIKKNVKQRVVMSIELLVRIHTWEKILKLYTIFYNFISVQRDSKYGNYLKHPTGSFPSIPETTGTMNCRDPIKCIHSSLQNPQKARGYYVEVETELL